MNICFKNCFVDNTNCYIEGKSKDYDGNIRQTMDGEKCLDWAACPKYKIVTDTGLSYIRDTDFPDGSITAASNYCRDPDAMGRPWCSIDNGDIICDTWGYCDIDVCNTGLYLYF